MYKDVKHSPLFSVITVCFNSEKNIENTIKSVLNQTFDDYEYIIIDGKSTDRTLDIVYKYMPLFKGKMTVISEKDSGIYEAMNKGINIAKGHYIGLLNSDDTYVENTLEIVSSFINKSRNNQVIYGMQRYISPEGKEVSINFYNINCIKEESLTHQIYFVSSDIYLKYGLYDTTYKFAADFDLLYRWCLQKEIKFVSIYRLLSNHYIGEFPDKKDTNYDLLLETINIKKKNEIIGNKQYLKYWLRYNVRKFCFAQFCRKLM